MWSTRMDGTLCLYTLWLPVCGSELHVCWFLLKILILNAIGLIWKKKKGSAGPSTAAHCSFLWNIQEVILHLSGTILELDSHNNPVFSTGHSHGCVIEKHRNFRKSQNKTFFKRTSQSNRHAWFLMLKVIKVGFLL